MMSERKLSYYEHVATQTCNEECQKIILQLTSEVRKLNTEADWLVRQLFDVPWCPFEADIEGWECSAESCSVKEDMFDCWREAARKAVQDAS